MLVSSGSNKEEGFKKRPEVIQSEIIRFRNESEQWIAVIGLINEKPYEIFTGKIDHEFIIPDWVQKGWIIKVKGRSGKRYDFQYLEPSGEIITIEGLSRAFESEYWNYAKLISGMLRLNMPIDQVVKLVEGLNLYDDSINTWKNGVSRALRHFISDGVIKEGSTCPSCGMENSLNIRKVV